MGSLYLNKTRNCGKYSKNLQTAFYEKKDIEKSNITWIVSLVHSRNQESALIDFNLRIEIVLNVMENIGKA